MREHYIGSTSKSKNSTPPSKGGVGPEVGTSPISPIFKHTRRLVTYVDVDVAAEIARRAQIAGRSVSAEIASLVAEVLPAAPDPEPPSPPAPPPAPARKSVGGWGTRPRGPRRSSVHL